MYYKVLNFLNSNILSSLCLRSCGEFPAFAVAKVTLVLNTPPWSPLWRTVFCYQTRFSLVYHALWIIWACPYYLNKNVKHYEKLKFSSAFYDEKITWSIKRFLKNNHIFNSFLGTLFSFCIKLPISFCYNFLNDWNFFYGFF